jgi:hypothetical protein
MSSPFLPQTSHLVGETEKAHKTGAPKLSLDSYQGKVHVEIDEKTQCSPTGTFGFFVDFLKNTGHLDKWIEECPLSYVSPNAPLKRDVLGTALLSVINGHRRYAHVAALRSDGINPEFLGMTKVVSEDSLRNGIHRIDEDSARTWQQTSLLNTVGPLLYQPWVLDIDTTIKPIYGNQEGADVSYNPHKPGRPSLTYHTYIMGGTRLVLDTEVRRGSEHGPSYTRPELWRALERLEPGQHPTFIRGDAAFGSEETMCWPENNGFKYLFKLRQSKNVKKLIEELEREQGEWLNAGSGWEGRESDLRLSSWTTKRRVVVIRREVRKKKPVASENNIYTLLGSSVEVLQDPAYENIVLVTNLDYPVEQLGQLYRDRADCENVFDELKNQWGWAGYTTKSIKSNQIMARIVAQIYNWWSIMTQKSHQGKHKEAITTRPAMLSNVAYMSRTGGGKFLKVSVPREKKVIIEYLSAFCWKVRDIMSTAEQLKPCRGWQNVIDWIFGKDDPLLGFG